MVLDITTIILLVLLICFIIFSIGLLIIFIICLKMFKKFLSTNRSETNELSKKIDKLLKEQINKEELFDKFFETKKNSDDDKSDDKDNEIYVMENNLEQEKKDNKDVNLDDLNSDEDDNNSIDEDNDDDIDEEENNLKDKNYEDDEDEDDVDEDNDEEILSKQKSHESLYESLKNSIFKNKKEANDDQLERSKLFIQEILNDKNRESFTFIDKESAKRFGKNNDISNFKSQKENTNETDVKNESNSFNLLNDQMNIFDTINNNSTNNNNNINSENLVDIKVVSNKIDKIFLEKENEFLKEAFSRFKKDDKDYHLKKINTQLLKEKKALQNAEEDAN